METSLRPKARPQAETDWGQTENAPSSSLRPRMPTDTSFDASGLDVEYAAWLSDIMREDPISRLGYDSNAVRFRDDKGELNAYYNPSERALPIRGGDYLPSDTVQYGQTVANSPDVVAHEFRHRGYNKLKDLLNEDQDKFIERYGVDAAELLLNGSDEYLTELFDDPSAEWNMGPDGEGGVLTGSMADTIQYASPDDLARKPNRATHVGHVPSGTNALRKAAEDLLRAEGEPPQARPRQEVKGPVGSPQEGRPVETGDEGWLSWLGSKLGLAEGGMVSGMDKEMKELVREGGLATDGATVDPVSGNSVPAGSNAVEVRDDVSASLSEGEYVVPADVVKFFGVGFFESLREKAKQGLSNMEKDGRISGGQSDEGPPISQEDIQRLEQMASGRVNMASGGMVSGDKTDLGGLIDRIVAVAKTDEALSEQFRSKGITMAEGGVVGDTNTGMSAITSQNTFNPNQWTSVGQNLWNGQTPANPQATAAITYMTYRGPNGETMMVPFQNGQPMSPIPNGFVPEGQYTETSAPANNRGQRDERPGPNESAGTRGWEQETRFETFSTQDWADWAESQDHSSGMGFGLLGGAASMGGRLDALADLRSGLMIAREVGAPADVIADLNARIRERQSGLSGFEAWIDNGSLIPTTGQRQFESWKEANQGRYGSNSGSAPVTSNTTRPSQPPTTPSPQTQPVRQNTADDYTAAARRSSEREMTAPNAGVLRANQAVTKQLEDAAKTTAAPGQTALQTSALRKAKEAGYDPTARNLDPRGMNRGGLVKRPSK